MRRAGHLFLVLALALWSCAGAPKVSSQTREEAAGLFTDGKGLLLKVEKDLGLDRPGPRVGMGLLSTQHFADLTRARLELREAAMLDPQAPWAPEAMLLAARTLDYGRLQQFPRAIEEYLDVAARFPETSEWKTAAARALVLRDRFGDPPRTPSAR
jgi:hypothetical protein